MPEIPLDESTEVTVADAAGTNKLSVNADGSINIVDASFSLADQDKIFQLAETLTITGGGTENNFLLLKNPSGSGKRMRLIDITLGFTNSINVMAFFKLYASPTVTANGSALTIKPGRIGGSTPASAIEAYFRPTISVRGSEYINLMVSGGPGSPSSYHLDFDQSILVDENYAVLLTGTPDGTNRNVLLTLRWAEV